MNQDSPTSAPADETPITPRPKQILNLRHTLAARPDPRPPASPAAQPTPVAEPSPTEPAADAQAPAATEDRASRSAKRDKPGPVHPGGPAHPAGEDASRPSQRRAHTVFYLTIDVSDRLRDVARRQNKTNADVIFDAIEAALPQLPDLLTPARVSGRPGGGVFDRGAVKPIGKKVQMSAVISGRNLKVIDQLVAEHGAQSRSQLVEASLNVYLTDLDPVTA